MSQYRVTRYAVCIDSDGILLFWPDSGCTFALDYFPGFVEWNRTHGIIEIGLFQILTCSIIFAMYITNWHSFTWISDRAIYCIRK